MLFGTYFELKLGLEIGQSASDMYVYVKKIWKINFNKKIEIKQSGSWAIILQRICCQALVNSCTLYDLSRVGKHCVVSVTVIW